jgi:carboxylesterase type B
MASREIKEAGVGNLGLDDRKSFRLALSHKADLSYITEQTALRWVQRYIHIFGGDPNKVTLYIRPNPPRL